MLLASLPARFTRFPFYMTDISLENEVLPDGQARYVPHGLRIIETLLLREFPASDIAVCYPGQMDRFIGDETRVVALHAHNPVGLTFGAGLYTRLYGGVSEPINAAEFRKMVQHPALRRHRDHLRVIVGGAGAWQIDTAGRQDEWGVDCLVDGEAEEVVVPLVRAAMAGAELPRRVHATSPPIEKIPRIRHRSTFGVVEITRGCGRGCQFCSIALRHGKSFPLEHILDNVRAQVAEGADTVTLVSEDIFLYEQGPRFATNVPALRTLLTEVAAVPGVDYLLLTHATIAPVVANPEVIDALSPVAVGKAAGRHPASSHAEHRYAMPFIGLETGSVRLFREFMKGKGYPFKPEQWPDVVLKGMELLNRQNWFPFCTWIIGLPGETDADTRESLDLLHALKHAKWCVVPAFFVPLEDTRLASRPGAELPRLTDLQWEFFFTCWRYNLDFFRNTRSVQWKFNVGVPLYYYALGRRLLGARVKYPMLRLAHVPERMLRRRLYLDLDAEPPARLRVPAGVPIPEWRSGFVHGEPAPLKWFPDGLRSTSLSAE
jgi:radical SAM superfamily enzyme YgiQ (UPF0313 family)